MNIDIKDMEILYQLDLDCRKSNKKIAKSIGMSKEGVNYRLRKLIDNGIITRFFADINLAKLGYTIYKIYLQFQNMTDDVEKEIYEYLLNHPSGIWVAGCNGQYDAIFTFKARNIVEFESIKNDIINKFSRYILNKQTVINTRYYLYNRKWLSGDFHIITTNASGGLPEEKKLDRVDMTILSILTQNARTPILHIAREAKISSSQIIYRIRKLIKRKILVSFKIDIDLKKIGYEYCKSFIYLQNITMERKMDFLRYCASQPNIIALVETIAPWDIELEFEVENFEKYSNIMSTIRKDFNDIIRNFESIIITKETGRLYKIEG